MADLIADRNTTEISTTSTSFVASGCRLAGADFTAGREYLILYGGSLGGDTSSTRYEAKLDYGGTDLGLVARESSSAGTPRSLRGLPLQGFLVLQHDGSSTLEIYYRRVVGGAVYLNSPYLVAFDLKEWTKNTDWFYTGTDLTTTQLSKNNTTFATITTQLIDFSGDSAPVPSIILASCEARVPSGTGSDGVYFKLLNNGSNTKPEAGDEVERNTDRFNWMLSNYDTILNVNGALQLQGAKSLGSNTAEFYRSRVMVMRAEMFAHVFASTEDAKSILDQGSTIDGTTDNWEDDLEVQVVTQPAADVLVLGHAVHQEGQSFRSACLRLVDVDQGAADSDLLDFASWSPEDINRPAAAPDVSRPNLAGAGFLTGLPSGSERIIRSQLGYEGPAVSASLTPGISDRSLIAIIPQAPPTRAVISDSTATTVTIGNTITVVGSDFGGARGDGAILLANNEIMEHASIVVEQAASGVWFSGVAQATATQGQLENGTAYLFVRPDSGTGIFPNFIGYPVTIAGGSAVSKKISIVSG